MSAVTAQELVQQIRHYGLSHKTIGERVGVAKSYVVDIDKGKVSNIIVKDFLCVKVEIERLI